VVGLFVVEMMIVVVVVDVEAVLFKVVV